MPKKFLIIILVAVIFAGAGGFFGGMKYTENKDSQGANVRGALFRQGFGGQAFNQGHERGDFSARGGLAFGGRGQPLFGEIISQGEGSFTIKLSDGSTRIIFISDSTQITKSINGTLGDLEIAEQIFVNGEENPDGSYTAKTIQIRP